MSTQIDLGPVLSVPKGDWNAATTYERLNIVRYNSSSWICNVATSKGVEPTEDSTDWYLQVKDTSSVTSINGMKGDVVITLTETETPPADDNSNRIATTEWVTDKLGDVDLSGIKEDTIEAAINASSLEVGTGELTSAELTAAMGLLDAKINYAESHGQIGLSSITKIDVDLNTLLDAGQYYVHRTSRDNLLNFPATAVNGLLTVQFYNQENYPETWGGSGVKCVRQIFYRVGTVGANDDQIFTRSIQISITNGTLFIGDWKKIKVGAADGSDLAEPLRDGDSLALAFHCTAVLNSTKVVDILVPIYRPILASKVTVSGKISCRFGGSNYIIPSNTDISKYSPAITILPGIGIWIRLTSSTDLYTTNGNAVVVQFNNCVLSFDD